MVEEKLSKREKRELKKQEEREKHLREKNKSSFLKWGIIGGIIILLGVGGWFLLQESSKPLPGTVMKDLGRDHVPKTEWEKYKYNSNPPTSGPHDVQWTKAGTYDSPEGEGYLVHSLEHGYIVISYNCLAKPDLAPQDKSKDRSFNFPWPSQAKRAGQNSKLIGNVYAHGTEEEHAKEATPSGTLDEKVWKSKECEDLKTKLSDIAKKHRLWKLIVIPRPSLDAKIALTAWARIDKMDTIDEQRIARFIDAFRDKGPEKTME